MHTQRGVSIAELLAVVAIVAILAVGAIQAWNNRNEPTETLKLDEWQCLKTEEREYTYPTLIGKITVMQTGRRDECVLWKRVR